MKFNFYPIVLMLISTLFVACKKDIEFDNAFSKSEKAWNRFKSAAGNSYQYMVNTVSWSGHSTETTIVVTDGKVTGRSFLALARQDANGQLEIRSMWREDTSDLNSHSEGAESLTLDEIYALAKNDLLKKREDANTYFETQNSGMISLCGYVSKACTDDCFTGIRIKYIER
ncbi:hypothetical protein [Chitinophaga rhizophila]|uniref:Lipoprotein n=1 Tax=Chitinophaga rhizophila TaxID=2866212 RepID=A0ABS7GM49_9BACT|nr:hypothetical protein [Chitinophaga rhizophila]MBW8688370.1 hypothetical protein [Chitinophaga rhizophila]